MTTVADPPKKPENKLAENILPIAAVAVLILTLVFAKGAVFALRPLLKFALPGGLVYFSWRWVKRKVIAVAGQTLRQKMDDAMRGGARPRGADRGPDAGGPVIDLCPKCGSYLKPGHRCAAKPP